MKFPRSNYPFQLLQKNLLSLKIIMSSGSKIRTLTVWRLFCNRWSGHFNVGNFKMNFEMLQDYITRKDCKTSEQPNLSKVHMLWSWKVKLFKILTIKFFHKKHDIHTHSVVIRCEWKDEISKQHPNDSWMIWTCVNIDNFSKHMNIAQSCDQGQFLPRAKTFYGDVYKRLKS